ncbi:MAG TPA: hypothetical protein VFA38_06200, partial [Nitrospirales bacterium]|nr:hypothetical protein [Nitrospirales bacterium]
GLYRACEAYMNGAINQEEYAYIVSGYDDFVVTVVGLDGLTQIVRENQPAGSGPPKTAPEAVAAAVERIIKSYLEHQVIMEKLYLQEKKH